MTKTRSATIGTFPKFTALALLHLFRLALVIELKQTNKQHLLLIFKFKMLFC